MITLFDKNVEKDSPKAGGLRPLSVQLAPLIGANTGKCSERDACNGSYRGHADLKGISSTWPSLDSEL
jgi:hypothetical protein